MGNTYVRPQTLYRPLLVNPISSRAELLLYLVLHYKLQLPFTSTSSPPGPLWSNR